MTTASPNSVNKKNDLPGALLWVLVLTLVLNRGGASINFQGGGSLYAPYNMGSLIIESTNEYICFLQRI